MDWYVLLIAAVAVLFYLVPTLVALSDSEAPRLKVALVNVFLGWTIIGWVLAAVLAGIPSLVRISVALFRR